MPVLSTKLQSVRSSIQRILGGSLFEQFYIFKKIHFFEQAKLYVQTSLHKNFGGEVDYSSQHAFNAFQQQTSNHKA